MVKADMIDLRPPRHRSGAIPLGASGSASVVAAAIMALAKGFARDGFGAFWRGFEISVRWTSCRASGRIGKFGRTRYRDRRTMRGIVKSDGAERPISGWTRVGKMVQIWPTV